MPWVDLPVKGGTYKNIEEEALNAVGASLLDGYLDEFGNVVGRPGLVEFCDLQTGEPVDGIYWWPVQKIAIAVSGKKVFKITDNNGSYVDITGDVNGDHETIKKLVRPTYADFGDKLYLANGAEPFVIRTPSISGLGIDLDTDAEHDIAIAAGSCKDTATDNTITLASALTKQIDASWSYGTNQGGFPSVLSLAADTWYKVFLIEDTTNNRVDAGFDTDSSATNLLADAPTYTRYRWIGSVLTDSSKNITEIIENGKTARLTDGDIPTEVTHVAVLDKYLIANEKDTSIVWFSDVAAPDSWSGDYFEPETKPDYVGALHAEYGEIYTFGRESTERWYDDGSSPWAHNPQGDTGRGWIAPYSVVAVDNGFIGLDEDRQVVKLQGASYQVLSPAVNAYIQGFETVADARGDHIVIAGRPFYILSFPTEGKTLVYNYTLPGDVPSTWLGWSEWTRFNAVTAEHEAFLGNCHAYSDKWNLNLVGDRRTGKIWKLDTSATTDGGGAIRTVRRTGFIDHGKYGHKKSRSLRVRIKRSQQGGKLLVRWRDRAQENAWSSLREYSLGDSGDLEQIVTIHQLGRYQTRQWEFVLSDNAKMLLMGAQEFIE